MQIWKCCVCYHLSLDSTKDIVIVLVILNFNKIYPTFIFILLLKQIYVEAKSNLLVSHFTVLKEGKNSHYILLFSVQRCSVLATALTFSTAYSKATAKYEQCYNTDALLEVM